MPRPRNGIQANAYAANAAIVIGMTVAGMVTMRLLRNASPMPFDADDLLVVLQRPLPCSNGWIRAVHQPVWVISWGFRKELTNRPAVGRVHRKQMTMTEMRSGRLCEHRRPPEPGAPFGSQCDRLGRCSHHIAA